MSVFYQQLLHDVGLRMSALVGVQLLSANTNYDTAVLTSVQFKSVDWPFNSFRDAILMAEETFANVAASVVDAMGVGSHPWRANLIAATTALADGAVIPATEAGGVKIIGAYGDVIDSTDNTLMSKKPWEVVRRVKAETWRKYPLYYYCFVGQRIFHTRANAIIGVCKYDRSVQAGIFTANGAMLLPDTAEPGIAALTISLMTRDGAFAEQAQQYHTMAKEALGLVANGGLPKAA